MKTYLNRRELLIGAGVGAIGTAAAVGAAPITVFAAEENDRVEGSWYVSVHITNPSGLPDFDATYGFARGGVFTRIDRRTNAPAVGTWKQAEDGGIVFSNLLFNFASGVVATPATRNGAMPKRFSSGRHLHWHPNRGGRPAGVVAARCVSALHRTRFAKLRLSK
jgi:hypothetical protein